MGAQLLAPAVTMVQGWTVTVTNRTCRHREAVQTVTTSIGIISQSKHARLLADQLKPAAADSCTRL